MNAAIESLEPRRLLSVTVLARITSDTKVEEVGGLKLFQASEAIHGQELWTTDGTPAGTRLLKDLVPGTDSSYPGDFVSFKHRVYFLTNNGLWRTDGTAEGTARIFATSLSLSIRTLLVVNDRLVFASYENSTRSVYARLWSSDGTAPGTARLINYELTAEFVRYSDTPEIGNFRVIGNRAIFSHNDGIHGQELWHTDGTAAGTGLLKDLDSRHTSEGPNSSSPGFFTTFNGSTYFFAAQNNSKDHFLWKTDGTAAGTVAVAKMPGQIPLTSYAHVGVLGASLFTAFYTDAVGTEPYRSDGTAANTTLLGNLFPGTHHSGGLFDTIEQNTSSPGNFLAYKRQMFFTAADPAGGMELWLTDESGKKTSRVIDIDPGAAGSAPAELVINRGSLFFTAGKGAGYDIRPHYVYDDGQDDRTLYRSDGTAMGTVAVRDLKSGAIGNNVKQVSAIDGAIYYITVDPRSGVQLRVWRDDGLNTTTDFLPATIFGTVFNDADHNGALNSSERKLGGATVWLDLDNDGKFDPSERSVVTNSKGTYAFDRLAPGTYHVRRLLPAGLAGTTPAAVHVKLSSGQTVRNRNFGAAPAGIVRGSLFRDSDRDGLRGSNESALVGWTAFVDLDEDGTLDLNEPAALSNEAGEFTIRDVFVGTHTVKVASGRSWAVTSPATGASSITLSTSGQKVNAGAFGYRRVN